MEPTPSYLRLRQIGLATDDLPQAARDLQSIFGLACAHEDPQVEIYGIRNALFPVGLSFIELIAPLHEGGRRKGARQRIGGDGPGLQQQRRYALAIEHLQVAAIALVSGHFR